MQVARRVFYKLEASWGLARTVRTFFLWMLGWYDDLAANSQNAAFTGSFLMKQGTLKSFKWYTC